MEIPNGYEFWKKVDEKNPYKTAKELADAVGIEYNTLRRQRSENRIPKKRFIEAIAEKCGCSYQYLLSIDNQVNQNETIYPSRIKAIADKLLRISPESLQTVETMVMALPEEKGRYEETAT